MLSIGFLIQFIIAIVCLAFISVNSQKDILDKVWRQLSDDTIAQTQHKYKCCGFLNATSTVENRNRCGVTTISSSSSSLYSLPPCYEQVKEDVTKAFELTGIIALIFSFTNVIYKHI